METSFEEVQSVCRLDVVDFALHSCEYDQLSTIKLILADDFTRIGKIKINFFPDQTKTINFKFPVCLNSCQSGLLFQI